MHYIKNSYMTDFELLEMQWSLSHHQHHYFEIIDIDDGVMQKDQLREKVWNKLLMYPICRHNRITKTSPN